MRVRRLFLAIVLCVACWPAPADAQGNGNAFGHYKRGGAAAPVPSAAGSPEIHISGTGTRNFGSWLDDASVLTPGDAFVGIGFGLWNMPGYREINVPMLDAGLGIHRRVQVSASVPYFYANEPGGPVASGFGNSYVTAKVQIREPRKGRLGFSTTPVLELLTAPPIEGGSRYSWGLPLNIELQQSRWRVFGSVGYFSRGAIFASGAVETAIGDRTWVTGSISQSHSMKADPLSFALGLAQTRTDLTGSVGVAVARRVSVYGSLGRTVSRADANSAKLALTGGVSFQFAR